MSTPDDEDTNEVPNPDEVPEITQEQIRELKARLLEIKRGEENAEA